MIEKIIHGNNIEVLKTFPDNYFDSVITDPPYGINFMNKKWDYDVPNVDTWKEVYRVLKPGGHMLVACGTRTQHRMAINIEDAGFEIRDIVAWVYGSGFPKSMDVSKAIDKHLGAEREVVGKAKGVGNNNTNSMKNGLGGSQEFKSEYDLTEPSTEQAKQWQGWGTALKPSMELWTLARKPLIGTVAENVIEYGVGGINIDESRIAFEETKNPATNPKYRYEKNYKMPEKGQNSSGVVNFTSSKNDTNVNGRFPANFIHDGSEEVEALFPKEAGGGNSTYNFEKTNQQNTVNIITNIKSGHHFGDNGSASRFFYVPKASQSERNYGLSFMESKTTTDGRKKPIDNAFNRGETERKNIHPTVKPIELMRYLIKMITPKDGIVLDLYAGSGSTLIAAKMDKFQYVGIEREKEYIDIINARIKAYVVEYDIFDFL